MQFVKVFLGPSSWGVTVYKLYAVYTCIGFMYMRFFFCEISRQAVLKTLNWIHVWRVAFTFSFSICYSWIQMTVFFSSLNWWIGCCIFLCVCMNPTQCEAVCMMWGHSIWSPHFTSKRVDIAAFFFFPPILDSTKAGAFLICDFLEHCARWEKKFVPFSYVCFSWGSLLLMYLNVLWMQ
jgi:hypothetical protein